MSLLNTTVRLMNQYLQDFPHSSPVTRLSVAITTSDAPMLVYVDLQDVFIGKLNRAGGGTTVARIDANLIDTTSSQVGEFTSPISQAVGTFFMVGDYSPVEGTQRLFQCLSTGAQDIQELDISDPELLVDSNVWDNVRQNGSDNGKTSVDNGFVQGFFQALGWAVFPERNEAVVTGARHRFDGTLLDQVIVLLDLNTGDGVPLASTVAGLPTDAVPGRYSSLSPNIYNQGEIFGETFVDMTGVQFIADDDSTHLAPKGQLMFGSVHIGGTPDKVYIRFNDWNPTNKVAAVGTANRIHLRETLLSRMEYQDDTVPSGSPLAPIDAVSGSVGNLAVPEFYFTSRGSRRLAIYTGDGVVNPKLGDTTITEYSIAAEVDDITKASEVGRAETNKTMSARVIVVGSLGERIANATVTFTLERATTIAELVSPLPIVGGIYTVANVPIDRVDIHYPNFGVFEDAIALTETTHYTVNEATGEITFIAPKPLQAGEVYTVTYAHPDTPATPPHGTLVITTAFTDVFGVAETRISYPDNNNLEDEIDQLTATV